MQLPSPPAQTESAPIYVSEDRLCAASSVISAGAPPNPFWWKVCAGSNTAATIAQEWPLWTDGKLQVRKRAGRIANLVHFLHEQPISGCTGISHTRWATHGPATDKNAHPHVGGDGIVAVVHNGVIENYAPLSRQLIEEGVIFKSDTDTEVIAQLIARNLDGLNLTDAVRKTLRVLQGTYGLAVVSPLFPESNHRRPPGQPARAWRRRR